MAPPDPPLPAVETHLWHNRDHHDGRTFRNPWPSADDDVPALKAMGWMVSYPFRQKPEPPATPFERVDPEALAVPPPEGRLRATWLGHTSVLLQVGGLTILTDPMFADRASPVSFAGPERQVPLPLDPDNLPPVDLVLLSHDHYDHLDLKAMRWLHERDRPLVLAPLRVGERLGAARAVDLDWGQSVTAGGADGEPAYRIHCTPARHFSGRTLTDRNRTLWASWYLEPLRDGLPRVYFAGDTGHAPHFREIAERHGAPDLVLMPIGAYRPRWFMARVHVDPEQALDAFEDLGGTDGGVHLLATHWGTFDLADEGLDEPPRLLRERAAARGLPLNRIHTLAVGGQVEVGRAGDG